MTGPPTDTRPADALLVDRRELSRLVSRSPSSLQRDVVAGRVPLPLRIGRSTRWRRSEIEGWIAAGCPAVRPAPTPH